MRAQDTEDESSFISIDCLQDSGISAADIGKLKSGGIFTIGTVMMTCKKRMTKIKGLSEAKVDKIKAVCSQMTDSSFMTGNQVREKRESVFKITMGAKSLDELLGGGLETMSITEAFGEFRTGKTQIAHTLCVTAQLPRNMGGGNGKVMYIDTEGTFRPDRIVPIAERYDLDPTAVLDNIVYARAYTHEHQEELLLKAAAQMVEDQFRLLVIDSITALFRVDFTGRGELAERQQKLGRMLAMITKMSEEFNIAVFITNQVVSDPGASAMFVSDPKKPIGGHIMAHASTTRLYLRKGRGEQRICKIYDSPCIPESECIYQIGNGGIMDPVD